MVGGVQISDVDEAVVALEVDENGRVKRVSFCVEDEAEAEAFEGRTCDKKESVNSKCAGAVDRGSGSGYSQGALREQEVLTLGAMRTEEDGGGRRRGRREVGGKGWLAGGQETCASAALLGEDKRRWLGFRGGGDVPVCQTVSSGWLLAVGFWELSVGCWVLGAAALCWLSGCLAGRGRQGGRAGARERGRERERAEREDGGKGSGRGGAGRAEEQSHQKHRGGADQSRPGSATVRTLSNVLVWSCPLRLCVNKTVLYVVVICEQRSNSGRAFGSSPDGLAASSSRFSSRWPRRHFLLRPLSCGLAWGWTATPCLAPRESPQPTG
ncbi:hypothetical protein F5882DRAFT_482974 [Hyaloscypha sp. PMI_1271]|nr:hypothetical protein F5882DRAFT_482974 [Hyaloscypha sp. PMI_1271]